MTAKHPTTKKTIKPNGQWNSRWQRAGVAQPAVSWWVNPCMKRMSLMDLLLLASLPMKIWRWLLHINIFCSCSTQWHNILCLFSFQAAVRIADKTSCLPDPLVPLDTKERIRPSPSKRSRKSSGRSNGTIKNRSSLESSTSQQPSVSNVNGPGAHVNEKLEAAIDSGSRDSRGTSIDRFSDVSRHSNSSRGYLVTLLDC